MSPSTGLAAAFADGPADPHDSAQLRRFHEQAYWLGKCAELVYPPLTPEGAPLEHVKENELDKLAESKKRDYRGMRPWYKVLFKKTDAHKAAEKAWHDAEEAWAGVANERVKRQVGALWAAEGQPPPEGFDVEFGSCVGTQYFVARDEKTIIICFRGTEPKKRWDVLLDVLSVQASDAEVQTGKVHLGFWTALDHVWGDVGSPNSGKTLPELLDREDPLRNDAQRVWLTGHSLGGALATVAADRLVVGKLLGEDEIGGVFTYGQPRVGDKAFGKDYPCNDRHFRFVNNNDIVTRVPPKNLKFLSVIFSSFFKKAAQADRPKTDANTSWMLDYSDVGRVIYANRSGVVTPLARGSIQRGAQLFFGRLMSRARAPFTPPFKPLRIMSRLFPGLSDHSMSEYNRALGNDDGAKSGVGEEG